MQVKNEKWEDTVEKIRFDFIG